MNSLTQIQMHTRLLPTQEQFQIPTLSKPKLQEHCGKQALMNLIKARQQL